MEKIFKIGDKVFHFAYGWGTVKDYVRDAIRVDFYDVSQGIRLFDGNSIRFLSFTEYTLNGFSQERPEELPKKGDIVWVRYNSNCRWYVGHFLEKEDDMYHISCNNHDRQYYGYELRTTNPYENEQD